MIAYENRFDAYAYRVGTFDLDATLLALSVIEDGTMVHLTDDGKLAVADGTKKSFIMTTSKKTNRDLITGKVVKKGAILVGAVILNTDQIETGDTWAPSKELYVQGGKLTCTKPTGTPILAGYSMSGLNADGTVRVYLLP